MRDGLQVGAYGDFPRRDGLAEGARHGPQRDLHIGNQTRAGGLTVNNGDPQYLENWFFALWA